jgi:ATP-dependent DNA ligase
MSENKNLIMDSLKEIKEMAAPEGVVLYTLDSKDRVRAWACWSCYVDDVPGIMYTDCILPDGKIKEPTFKTSKEKNVGKANYISAEQQAILMVDMEKGKKLRNNYFYTITEAKNNKQFKPMLAHKYEDKFSKMDFPVASQPKLDGARCNAMLVEGEVKIYSRSCKEYVSCPHISEALTEYLSNNPSIILDGELYNHDLKHDFEQIMSLIRQTKPQTRDFERSKELVQFHIYDIYDKNMPELSFGGRFLTINSLKINNESIKFVPTYTAKTQEDLDSLYQSYTEQGYEGQMVRNWYSSYKVDGRSSDLLKRKEFYDNEFEIIEFEEGEAAWAGKAKKVYVKLDNGNVCGCGIRGSFDYCEELFKNKDKYVGKLATVRYFEETKDGMLRFPVVIDLDRHDV